MSAARRTLTFTRKALAPSRSRVEKPRCPDPRKIPEWVRGYQRRLEDAQKEYLHITEQGEPEEADQGQGEVSVTEASLDLVQERLSELAQQHQQNVNRSGSHTQPS